MPDFIPRTGAWKTQTRLNREGGRHEQGGGDEEEVEEEGGRDQWGGMSHLESCS